MAVTYLQNFHVKKKPCITKLCKECGLYIHQAPIFDERRKSGVFWVGLSAVLFEKGQEKMPLSPLTRSGALIEQAEEPFRQKLVFYKTNLVKCVPLKADKIRYPMEHEMEKCFPNFEWELEHLKPSTVFLLGKQVAGFVLKKLSNHLPVFNEDFNYTALRIGGINFIPVHHPSYILVYKRKNLSAYIQGIQKMYPKRTILV